MRHEGVKFPIMYGVCSVTIDQHRLLLLMKCGVEMLTQN